MKFKHILDDIIRKEIRQIAEADTALDTKKPMPLSQIAGKKGAANAAVQGGQQDGDKSDDVVAGSTVSVPVSKLKPAQTEIIKEKAFGMAVGMLLSGKWNGLSLGSIISNDNYIMDGHHRWAAVSLIDPSATIKATQIDLPGGPLVTALNLVTVGKLGIASGNKGKGNVADFTSAEIGKAIDAARSNGLPGDFPKTPDDVNKALGAMPGANGDPELGREIMMQNADKLPKQIMPGAPPRVEMPVIDGSKVAIVQKLLQNGMIDIEAPYSDNVKQSFNLK